MILPSAPPSTPLPGSSERGPVARAFMASPTALRDRRAAAPREWPSSVARRLVDRLAQARGSRVNGCTVGAAATTIRDTATYVLGPRSWASRSSRPSSRAAAGSTSMLASARATQRPRARRATRWELERNGHASTGRLLPFSRSSICSAEVGHGGALLVLHHDRERYVRPAVRRPRRVGHGSTSSGPRRRAEQTRGA